MSSSSRITAGCRATVRLCWLPFRHALPSWTTVRTRVVHLLRGTSSGNLRSSMTFGSFIFLTKAVWHTIPAILLSRTFPDPMGATILNSQCGRTANLKSTIREHKQPKTTLRRVECVYLSRRRGRLWNGFDPAQQESIPSDSDQEKCSCRSKGPEKRVCRLDYVTRGNRCGDGRELTSEIQNSA